MIVGNRPKNHKSPREHTLLYGPSEIVRPLYNSNMAKVSNVNWSWNTIFCIISPVSGIPKIVNIPVLHAFY